MPLALRKEGDLKNFFPLGLALTGLCLLACRNVQEIFVVTLCYGAGLVNLYMTQRVVKEVIFSGSRNGKLAKGRIFLYSLGKIGVLFGALALGAEFMGRRIVVALLNHVGQIFLLCLVWGKRA